METTKLDGSVRPEKCLYDKWMDGEEISPNKFFKTMMDAYVFADGANQAKIRKTWPEWFEFSANVPYDHNAAIISTDPDLMTALTSIPLIRLQTIAEWMNADDMREFAKNVELAINKAYNSEIYKGTSLVEDMKKTYLAIQILVQSKINKGETLLAFETDGIRADLRNAITKATGEDSQALQESIEAEAYNRVKL